MKMSKRDLVLLIGLAFFLVVSLGGCSSDAYQEGFQAGYEKGDHAGYERGYYDGLGSCSKEIEAARQDGYDDGYAAGLAECNGTLPPNGDDAENGEESPPPLGAIWWYEGKEHVGERLTICGPVKSSSYNFYVKGEPTFLNLGEPYPHPDRFTIVIWGDNRSNFPSSPETHYQGRNICVTGLIELYGGIPEIEVTSPDQVQIQ